MSSGRWQLLWVNTVAEWSCHISSLRCILKLLCILLCQILRWSVWYVLARVSTQIAGHGFDGLWRVPHVLALFRRPAVLLHIGKFSSFGRRLPHCVKSPYQRPKHVIWDTTLFLFEQTDLRKDFLHTRCSTPGCKNQRTPPSALSYSFFWTRERWGFGRLLGS